MEVSRGFTLIEVVVSLLIMATGLVLLLVTIQGGLTHVRTSRLELESCLKVQTAADLFALGVVLPETDSGSSIEVVQWPHLPELEMVCLELGEGDDTFRVWVSRIRDAEEPAN